MKIIIGLLNMESTGGDLQPFCFIPGLDNLYKQMVNYLFPTFMLISLWLISFTAHIHPIAARFLHAPTKRELSLSSACWRMLTIHESHFY